MQQDFLKKYIKTTKLIISVLFVFTYGNVKSAEITSPIQVNWTTFSAYSLNNVLYGSFHTFTGAGYQKETSGALPVFSYKTAVNSDAGITVKLKNEVYETITDNNSIQDKKLLKNDITITHQIVYTQKRPFVFVTFVPIRYNAQTGRIEKLISFDVVVASSGSTLPNYSSTGLGKKTFVANSVMASGEWIKLGVNQTGMHALTKTYLKNIGINVDAIDPRTIKIYGYGAGMLPQKNSEARFDDLPENAIIVEGESDGVFGDNDRVLFFGRSQKDVWKFNSGSSRYEHITNIYSDISYYFITWGGSMGKRVTPQPAQGAPNTQVSEFDQVFAHEEELTNLIKSGRRWMGEEFSRVTQQNFQANMGSVNTSEPVYIRSCVTAHSYTPSSFSVSVNGSQVISHSLPLVIPDFERPYATDGNALLSTTTTVSTGSLTVSYFYNLPIPGSVGWLDFFELNSRNFISQNGEQIAFRDSRSVGAGKISQFNISTSTPVVVWDITDPTTAQQMIVSFGGGLATFVQSTDALKEFISFTGQQFHTPVSAVRTANQNLHGLPFADLFIITHSAFINESQTLAQFHFANSGLKSHVVTVEQIYNEFSSGSQDVSAIRDFLRLFYKKAATVQEMPKYVTLFGRASYDYKDRITNNTNFVPTYESIESYDPVNTYNSDDYFGLLDDNEGHWDSDSDVKETLDVAIGRLPSQDNIQAQNMINKTMSYVNNPAFGDWKTKLVFVADDEDGNVHQNQANGLADNAKIRFKDYNIKKIFIDAFPEENTSGGARNPAAQAEIVRAVEQGAAIINYTGHGGEVGWAGERILNTDDIKGWTNGNRLPLFVTATCEFSRFDDPARTSAGEMVLLNPNGGGIALFTTVRLVSSGSNEILNKFFYDHIGLDSASAFNRKRIGEIMKLTKNDYGFNDKNERNFTLLGDPALFLEYPTGRVQTTQIDNSPVAATPDTLKAFAKITISGKITDINNNNLTGFNGIIYPTVYDKPSLYKTIGNNPTSPVTTFSMQNNVIYRGKASVTNGVFTFSFVVPKDISYEIGYGKISYAADNGSIDAIGQYNNIIIGSTSDTFPPDNTGPEMRLYLNDEKFVYGGITNENPTLIVKLTDENGINITGRGVGRDISMVLNNDVTKNTSLNDYYQAKTDSYKEGEVNYKMKALPQGKNVIKMRAYDIYNNSSDALLEFVVATSEQMALQHVLNYPNPFTTNTTFHFDHNKAGEQMTVQVQVFTISGKLIRTLQMDAVTSGNHFDQLSWDGRDDYGDNIGKGVYIYKVKVRSVTGKSAEEFQKLVILN
jgi:hypothetical protein